MKKISAFLAAAALVAASSASAQITFNGVLSEPEWGAPVGSFTGTRGFGPYGVQDLHVFQDNTHVFVGLRCTPEGNFNGTFLVFGSNAAGLTGAPAGSPLPSANGGPLDGFNHTFPTEVNATLRLGYGSVTEAYFNGFDYEGPPADNANSDTFLGGGAGVADGGIITGSPANGIFNNWTMAFQRVTAGSGHVTDNTNEGWELRIPKASLGLSDGDELYIVALYGDGSGGFLAGEAIPDSTLGGNGANRVIPAAYTLTISSTSSVADWTQY